MRNKKKGRNNKFRTPVAVETIIKTKDLSEVQKMPVPVERKVEEAPIESIKTQVQDEPNNNELTSVLEESIVLNVVEEEPNENVVAEDSKTDPVVLEAEDVVAEEDSTTDPVVLEAVNAENDSKMDLVVLEIKNVVAEEDSKTDLEVLETDVIKHPLEHTWCLWLFTNENKKNWADNMRELTFFDTVEDYWCLYHHTKLPSQLRNGQDYAIFKRGISPMWEDPANRPGGRWFINLEQRVDLMDRVWLDVVLLMIGECIVNSDVICGAVVNVRTKKPNKVSIWTRSKNEADVMPIGRQLKQMLQIPFKLQFLDHKNICLYLV